MQRESRPEEALAFWTEHPATPAVEQRIRSARSADGGRTFQVEPGLCATRNSPNFRDPFVFWHAESTRWIMLVAEPCNWSATEGSHRSRLHVYHSLDLQGWTWVSEIRLWDAPSIMWEVPQLVSLDVHGRATCCLIISTVGHSGDASWCSVRYRFGSLGGERFEPYHAEDRWWSIDGRIGGTPPDYGPDFYAAIVSASRAGSIRDSHGLSTIAWLSNWRDARKLPLQNLAGGPMTSPRPLQAFVDVNGNARVRQRATAAVWHSGGKPVVTADTVRIGRSISELAEFATLCFVVEATFDVPSPGSYIELLLVGCDGGGEASFPPVTELGRMRGDFSRYAGSRASLSATDTGDEPKIVYLSAPLRGLRFGASYAPKFESNADDPDPRRRTIQRDAVELGVQYQRPLANDWTLGAAAVFVNGNSDPITQRDDLSAWSVGFEARRDKLIVGAAYVDNGDSNELVPTDETEWNVGVAWRDESWGAAVSFAAQDSLTFDNRLFGVGGYYELAKYFTVRADAVYIDEKRPTGVGGDGSVLLVELGVQF